MAILSFSKGRSTLNVINNINTFEDIRGTSIAKISAGVRIRKASDSVAESAIGTKIKTEVESLKQILTGTASAKSVLEIAEGAMSEITNIITRMTSLTLQATNSTNTDDDRAKIDSEFQELKEEVSRISDAANFNTKKILNGGESKAYIGQNMKGYKSVSFDKNSDMTSTFRIKQDATGKIEITNNTTGESQAMTVSVAPSPGSETSVNFDKLGITLTLDSGYTPGTAINLPKATAGKEFFEKIASAADDDGGVLISNIVGKAINADTGAFTVVNVAGDNAKLKITAGGSVFESEVFNFKGQTPLNTTSIKLNNVDGSGDYISVIPSVKMRGYTTGSAGGTADLPTLSGVTGATSIGQFNNLQNMISPNNSTLFKFQVGTSFTDANYLKLNIESVSANSLGIGDDSINLKNIDSLGTITNKLRSANSVVQDIRTKIAVTENRLDVAIKNIQTTITNSESAVSAIFDLDIPSEIADLSSVEMKQTASLEALSRDIRAKQNLLKLF